MLGKQTLTARVSTFWPQVHPSLIIQMSPKGRLKQQQSEEPGEQMYPRVCFRKIPGEKRARLTHTVARASTPRRKEIQIERTEKEGGGVSNQVHSRMPSTSANELRSPTNLGDSDRPVFFMLLHLPVACAEPQVGLGWPRKGPQWFDPPYII